MDFKTCSHSFHHAGRFKFHSRCSIFSTNVLPTYIFKHIHHQKCFKLQIVSAICDLDVSKNPQCVSTWWHRNKKVSVAATLIWSRIVPHNDITKQSSFSELKLHFYYDWVNDSTIKMETRVNKVNAFSELWCISLK